MTLDKFFVLLAVENIANSPTWWKQISKVFKSSEIDPHDQFSTSKKFDYAILQEINREVKRYDSFNEY